MPSNQKHMYGESGEITDITLTIEASFYGTTTIGLKIHDDCELKIKRDLFSTRSSGGAVTTKHKITHAEINHLLEKLSGLRIPAVPSGITGLDGSTYTLKIEQMLNAASYTWWVEPPEGWEGLEEAAKMMIEMAEKYVEG